MVSAGEALCREPASDNTASPNLKHLQDIASENWSTHRLGGSPSGSIWFAVHPTAQVGLSIFVALGLIAYKLSSCKLRKGSAVLARCCPCSPLRAPALAHGTHTGFCARGRSNPCPLLLPTPRRTGMHSWLHRSKQRDGPGTGSAFSLVHYRSLPGPWLSHTTAKPRSAWTRHTVTQGSQPSCHPEHSAKPAVQGGLSIPCPNPDNFTA